MEPWFIRIITVSKTLKNMYAYIYCVTAVSYVSNCRVPSICHTCCLNTSDLVEQEGCINWAAGKFWEKKKKGVAHLNKSTVLHTTVLHWLDWENLCLRIFILSCSSSYLHQLILRWTVMHIQWVNGRVCRCSCPSNAPKGYIFHVLEAVILSSSQWIN